MAENSDRKEVERRLDDLEAHVRRLVRQSFGADHDRWGDVSLGVAIPRTDVLRIDTISEGLWA
jgi:hypothetical protein